MRTWSLAQSNAVAHRAEQMLAEKNAGRRARLAERVRRLEERLLRQQARGLEDETWCRCDDIEFDRLEQKYVPHCAQCSAAAAAEVSQCDVH